MQIAQIATLNRSIEIHVFIHLLSPVLTLHIDLCVTLQVHLLNN